MYGRKATLPWSISQPWTFHSVLHFVTKPTLKHWSSALHTNRPCLSGLQLKLLIGCEDRLRLESCCMLPATPSSLPSWSCKTQSQTAQCMSSANHT